MKIGAVKRTGEVLKPLIIFRDLRGKKKIHFAVRAPKLIAPFRHVQEVLPLRNSIFFNMGSAEIPVRYKQISTEEAKVFNEAQMVKNAPDDLGEGRSSRQMAIYHQILNITGDRLRAELCSLPHLTYTAPYMDANARGGTLYNRYIYTAYIRTANLIAYTSKRIRSRILK